MNTKIDVFSNMLKSVYNYKSKKTYLNSKPLTIWVEPTNHCNLKCVMCPQPAIPRDDLGFMDMDVYKNIIDQVQNYAAAIELLFAGESLLHKKIFEMIKYAKSKGIQVVISTNGVLLDKRRDDLLNSGLDRINIAFDGYNKPTYEKIRVGANFEKVVNNTVNFLKEKKRRNQKNPLVVMTTLEVGLDDYEDIDKERNEFYSIFDGLPVDEFISKQPNTWGGYFKETDEFNHQQLNQEKFYPCSHLWTSINIRWDGSVLPCCFDFFKGYVVGNTTKTSIDDIWNSEKMISLRKAHLKGGTDSSYIDLNPLCEDCIIVNSGAIFGVPAGMRSSIRYTLLKQFGFKFEKYLIQIAGMLSSDYSLKIVNSKSKSKSKISLVNNE